MFIFCIALFLSIVLVPKVQAAKTRVWNRGGAVATVSAVSYSSAKLSRMTNSVVLTLKNLVSVNKVSYELQYNANNESQGAMGSVLITGQTTDTRDLYFGTCSHGACTPHTNISGATLVVTTYLQSGSTNVKRYRIKV